MKFITAIIKPHKLEDVREGLVKIGVEGLTISEVKGYGRQGGHTEIYRGAEYKVNYVPKLRIDVAVDDALAQKVVEVIEHSARTGEIGDGKIFVYGLEHVVRIRTGEQDHNAL